MAFRGGKIGDAYVDLHAPREQLDADLSEARVVVEKQTKAMGAAADRNIGGGFFAAGKQIQDSTAGVRKFQGAISSVAGVATGLLGTITLIGAGIASIAAAAKLWWEYTEKAQREGKLQAANYERISLTLEDQLLKLNGANEEIRISAALTREYREEEEKLFKLLKENQLSQEQYKKLAADTWDVLNAKATEQKRILAESSEQYKGFLAGLEEMKKRAAEAREEQRKLNEEWQKTFEFISDVRNAEQLGPPREAWEQAGRNAAAAFSQAFSSVAAGQVSGLGGLSGTIETLAERMEAVIEASSHASSRRQS